MWILGLKGLTPVMQASLMLVELNRAEKTLEFQLSFGQPALTFYSLGVISCSS